MQKGGRLGSLRMAEADRAVRTCDALGIPLLVIIDVPGYLPGVRQEREGVVRRATKPLRAYLAGQGQGLPEMTGGLLVTSCRPYI